jgi:TonB-linked SusC/RagA family outer membrane protein
MRQKIDCTIVRTLVGLLLLLFISSGVNAQKQVTGTVKNAKDNSVIGFATITVKGTNVAAVSNADGSFAINLPAGKNTIIVSSVGFTTKEVDASSGNVAISLAETSSSLDEIVVTGYTAQKKRDIAGSVAVVNVKDIKQMPVGTGEAALQGHASGLTVITSGQPGAQSDIRIRGNTGFFGNNPLIIVDGVQSTVFTTDANTSILTNINPADIESVQILKDAAAAQYGVRGANGVIIITTKKGHGAPKISYDGYVGVATRGPGYDMANTQEEANAIWQQQLNSDPNAVPTNKQFGTGQKPVIPDYITPTGYILCNCAADSNFVSPSLYNLNSYQITKANKQGTNWYDVITRNAITQSHNVSVSAGTEKNSYYFSFNYLDQQGIADFQYLKRYAVRANTLFAIKNNIHVGENAYVYYTQNPRYGNQGEGSPFSVVFREDEIIPVYDIMGNFGGTKSQGLGNSSNPYADIYRTKDNKTNNWNIVGNLYADVDFLKHFTAHTSFGGSINNNYNYNFNYVAYENAEGNTGSNSFSEGASYNNSWTFTNTLRYSNVFGQHNVTALVGTEAIQTNYRFLSGTRSNYFVEIPSYWTLNSGSGAQTNSGGAGIITQWSQIGRLEYSYAGKYIVNGTIRRDNVSVFSPDQRTGYFPGVSVAWRISQESFLKNVAFINDLKIRASWADLGTYSNVGADNPYDLYSLRSGKSFYDIAGSSTNPAAGIYRSHLGNPSTTWEEDKISNIGFDATILKNTIDISIDWYKKKASGLLYTASGPAYTVPIIGDADRPNVNIATNQNTGIDFNGTYHGSISKDFKFDVTATFTSYKNKILSIPGSGYFDEAGIRNVTVVRDSVNHPLNAFYGYQVVGLFQSADDISKSPTQTGAKPGLFKYADINHDGKIDDADRTFIGDPNPDFTYGLNISLSYKNIDLSAFFFGSHGNDIFNFTKYYTDFPDFFKGGLRRDVALNSWTPQNTNTSIPALYTAGSFSSDLVTNSYFLEKGSYFRCKQIQVGYTIPTSTLSHLRIDHIRIYVQAADLFTITKYSGLDPELQSFDIDRNIGYGIDQGNYPHTPAYLVGLNVNF